MDDTDLALLDALQQDSSLSYERIGRKLGLSKTAVWSRVQRLQRDKVIRGQVALLDADQIGVGETAFVAIRTAQHSEEWLKRFSAVVAETPEIVEAHRMAGEIDYLLKVRIANTRDFDRFYRGLIRKIDLYNVTSTFSMETMKATTALPIRRADAAGAAREEETAG
ncbi:MAG: Lrp/AsnC family transcriptional regulator [Pseudomonadota bacterium]